MSLDNDKMVALFPNVSITLSEAQEILLWLNDPVAAKFFSYLRQDCVEYAITLAESTKGSDPDFDKIRGQLLMTKILHPISQITVLLRALIAEAEKSQK